MLLDHAIIMLSFLFTGNPQNNDERPLVIDLTELNNILWDLRQVLEHTLTPSRNKCFFKQRSL